MRFIIEWPGNQPPPNELINPLVLRGAIISELPSIKTLAIPGGKPLTNPELEQVIDASMASKSSPIEVVFNRIAGKINGSN